MLRILLYADTVPEKVQVNTAYVEFLSQFGEVILVMPSNNLEFFIEIGDVLALPGGADVDPMRYNEYPRGSKSTNPAFEYLDKYLLGPWIKTKKPILGICRGLQTLNVAMGGSLYQDIDGHVQYTDRDRCDQKMYTDIPGYEINRVNSFHHQAVKTLADDFEVIGWSVAYKHCASLKDRIQPDGRYIYMEEGEGKNKVPKRTKGMYFTFPEIIRHKHLPYIAVQYHPEEFFCPLATELFAETLNLTLNYEPNKANYKISN
jgi:putative glutamine amidotransferase